MSASVLIIGPVALKLLMMMDQGKVYYFFFVIFDFERELEKRACENKMSKKYV